MGQQCCNFFEMLKNVFTKAPMDPSIPIQTSFPWSRCFKIVFLTSCCLNMGMMDDYILLESIQVYSQWLK
jgi:mRNA deadenylase 3'-5' endonuclease subunit Ccr4